MAIDKAMEPDQVFVCTVDRRSSVELWSQYVLLAMPMIPGNNMHQQDELLAYYCSLERQNWNDSLYMNNVLKEAVSLLGQVYKQSSRISTPVCENWRNEHVYKNIFHTLRHPRSRTPSAICGITTNIPLNAWYIHISYLWKGIKQAEPT